MEGMLGNLRAAFQELRSVEIRRRRRGSAEIRLRDWEDCRVGFPRRPDTAGTEPTSTARALYGQVEAHHCSHLDSDAVLTGLHVGKQAF